MRIPPYWSRGTYTDVDNRGRARTVCAYGWSFTSREVATADANERAKRAVDRIIRGEAIDTRGYYLEHPLREEIVDALKVGEAIVGIVTRNRYGSLVLNSPMVLFADLDIDRPRPRGLWEWIRWSFSGNLRSQRQAEAHNDACEQVRRWAQSNSGHSLRLYQTAGGLRLLFTDGHYGPRDAKTDSILNDLRCDPLYRRLCERQECFRARLTPKPWRCGCEKPRQLFPWRDAEAEQEFRQWEKGYQRRAAEFPTCRLLDFLGDERSCTDEVKATIDLHDRYTCHPPTGTLA